MELDSYQLLMFLHILGAMGLLAGLGIEAVAVKRLARMSSVEQVRDWVAVSGIALWTSVVSMVVLLLAGAVMMAIRWGPSAWTITALIALVVIALVSQIQNSGLRLRCKPLKMVGWRCEGGTIAYGSAAARRLTRSRW
jgi:phosphatidylserine synthase